MSRERAICGLIAVLCHGTLLFGIQVRSLPRLLPPSEESVEVSLVAAAPAAAPAEPAAPPAAASPSPPPPPPAPAAEPIPEPDKKPEPAPPLATPPRREPPKPQRPAALGERKPAPPAAVAGDGALAATGAAGGPHGISPAHPSSNPKPPYPPDARRLRQEGRVLLQVAVSAEGRVTNVSVIRSSGTAALDDSAVATVRRWTFFPARAAGVAVASRVEVPVAFSLSN